MAELFVLQALTHPSETQAVIDRIGHWLDVDRPDGFFDVKELENWVHLDAKERPWACVKFEAADRDMAEFMASLATRECGLNKTVKVVPA